MKKIVYVLLLSLVAAMAQNQDWDIYDNVVISDTTIVMNGNLTIYPGGSLTLSHVTLKMNVLDDGQYYIEVKSGGAMYIRQGCLITDGDSDDDALPPEAPENARFLFWVRNNAIFEMSESELHECGYSEYSAAESGLWILANDAVINNNLITQCYYGINLEANNGSILSNTISYCYRGIYVIVSNYTTVDGNTTAYNDNQGIVIRNSEYCTVKNNTSFYNGREGMLFLFAPHNVVFNNNASYNQLYGINIYCSSANAIKNNLIIGNAKIGVIFGTPEPGGDRTVDNIFQGNTITNNFSGIACGCGIADCNRITENNITDNIYGIRIFDYSDTNRIDHNIISRNTYGVFLITAVKTEIVYNTITENGYGIYCAYYWDDPRLPDWPTGFSENSRISYNTLNLNEIGIFLDSGSVNTEIKYNTITKSSIDGIRCFAASQTQVMNNNITDNNAYGINNLFAPVTGNIIDARNNWWGDPTGPCAPDYAGLGDAVSYYVDYVPWLIKAVSITHNSSGNMSSSGSYSNNSVPFTLLNNEPNPFSQFTNISYVLLNECRVVIDIYNLQGQKITTLVNTKQSAGIKTIGWNALDDEGRRVTSGIYLYRIKAGDRSETRKCIVF